MVSWTLYIKYHHETKSLYNVNQWLWSNAVIFNRFNLVVSVCWHQMVLKIFVWAKLFLYFKMVNSEDKVSCMPVGTLWATSGSRIAKEHRVLVNTGLLVCDVCFLPICLAMDSLRRANRLSVVVPRFKPSGLLEIHGIRQSCYYFQEQTNRAANTISMFTSDMR